MILTSITLSHFRNYTRRTFKFSPNLTIIIGPNTSGKTNILEAVYAAATGKSFRAEQDREMISWESEVAGVTALTAETTLELVITGGAIGQTAVPMKKYKVNGVPRRMIDFVGNLRAVLFWPEHLDLVTDSPSLRRRYLDSVLIQVDREYRRNLLSYERGLRQRNKLLDLIAEGKAVKNQLLFWNQLLIRAGGYLTDRRSEYLTFINSQPLAIHHYRIYYDKSIISESRLAQYANEEVAAGATLVGPHRDDFRFYMAKSFRKHHQADAGSRPEDEIDVEKFGSRGEQRLAILWLKLAELLFIREKTGERPVLLLDDIFSELDRDHRELVLELIGKQQTVVTSADNDIGEILPQSTAAATEKIKLP